MSKHIVILAGDGIGPEIMAEADPEETQLIHIAADGVRGWWQR